MSLTTITAHLVEMADEGIRWFNKVLVVKRGDDEYAIFLPGGERAPEGRDMNLKAAAKVIQREQGDTKEFPAVVEPDDDNFGPGVGPA